MGTVRADAPRLDARDVGATRQPRRLAFGRGPLPDGSELELRSGPLEEELRALAAEGVQSLLLEGGPTLATAFLEADLVDKLLVFVAPVLGGEGPRFLGDLADAARAAPDLRAQRRSARTSLARGVPATSPEKRGAVAGPPSRVRRESLLRTERPASPVAVVARTTPDVPFEHRAVAGRASVPNAA